MKRGFLHLKGGYAIQGKFKTWLVNSTVNFTWKTDIRDSRDIGFSREI